ncbi:uncharacterized protein LOC123551686 [Mercenaria mercenaria]|uniref:uncharacterized protein LOC123551686 n=1 Tax=Mercenaria mercenaria TaxID=6596 RepID=UPI001E1D7E75|nr:uncharacterized protein LOC123551686 [Mercenaria mercenaria]
MDFGFNPHTYVMSISLVCEAVAVILVLSETECLQTFHIINKKKHWVIFSALSVLIHMCKILCEPNVSNRYRKEFDEVTAYSGGLDFVWVFVLIYAQCCSDSKNLLPF